jgi:acylglycerol lipase
MINEYKKILTCDDIELNVLIHEEGHKDWLIHLHDYGEHHGRHQHVLDQASRFHNIIQVDLRGHGDSGGDLSKIRDFRVLTRDLDDVIHFLKKEYSLSSYSLMGHGLSGLIICDYLQNFAKKDLYPNKVFLVGPLLFLHGAVGQLLAYTEKYVFSALDKVTINFSIPNFIDPKKLSHDGRIFQSYCYEDKVKTSISSHFLYKLLKTARDVNSRPLRANCQLSIAMGGEDDLINVGLTEDYFNRFERGSKILVVDGAYRELQHEVEMFRYPYEHFLKNSLFDEKFSMKLL